MLNTDGSVIDSNHGCAGLLRNIVGDVNFSHQAKEGMPNVLQQELMAIAMGLQRCV